MIIARELKKPTVVKPRWAKSWEHFNVAWIHKKLAHWNWASEHGIADGRMPMPTKEKN